MTARLLLVDDDPDLLPLITDLLRADDRMQWHVEWASTAAEGERLLAGSGYDAALVDYHLGGITGVELVRRARAAGVRTPLIMLTSHGDRRVDVAAMEAGADDFLQKDMLSEGILERSLRYATRHAEDVRRLEQREQHFRALIQLASDAILLLDAGATILFASDSVMRVTGFTGAQLVGRSAFEGIHSDDVDYLRAKLDECLMHPGRHITVSYRAHHADGSWRHREVSAVNRLTDPAVRAVVVNCRDVTDRIAAELARDHLAAIVRSSQDAIFSTTLAGDIVSWNVAAERLYGYTAAEAVGMPAVTLMVHPDERERFGRLLQRVNNGESVTVDETQRIRKDGSRVVVSVTLSPVRDSSGAVTGVASVARDVSSWVEARRALSNREREFRSLFHNSPVGLVRASVEGTWEDVNAQACVILEYSADELLGVSFAQIIHPDDREASLSAFHGLRSGQRAGFDAEKRYRTKRGNYVWVRVRVNPFYDERGDLRHFIVAFSDVTGRRAMEEELRSTVGRLEALIAHLPLSIWVLDRDGVVTFSEGRLLQRFGVSGGELVGRSQLEIDKDNGPMLTLVQRALAGEEVHSTAEVGGNVFETWYQPLRDSSGHLIGTVGVAIEITERLQLEAQYRQAQKMEAVGLLAGGVAHDFNNLLTAIIGYAEMALEHASAHADLQFQLEQVLQAAHSAGSLTRQLLAFSRRQLLQPRVMDVNATAKSTHGLLSRLIGEDITLVMDLGASQQVFADPGQLQQIMLNLAVNARDAMPKGGTLSVRTSDVTITQEFVALHAGASVGPHVRLEVTDTGVGMPADVRSRIFEPFFTTKELGRGTGLGLATVYGIVKQSGGSIWVDSVPGHGTTFSILLPVTTETLDTAKPLEQPQRLQGRQEILVVEDQPDVRRIARMILERHGYDVHDAATPAEALALVRQGVAKPVLLFSDVVMPGMSGRELAQQLQVILPEMRVLFTSGYTDDSIVRHGVLEAGFSLLPKPYTGRELLLRAEELIR